MTLFLGIILMLSAELSSALQQASQARLEGTGILSQLSLISDAQEKMAVGVNCTQQDSSCCGLCPTDWIPISSSQVDSLCSDTTYCSGLASGQCCCLAPESYSGSCSTCSNLNGYSYSQKLTWGQECGATYGPFCCPTGWTAISPSEVSSQCGYSLAQESFLSGGRRRRKGNTEYCSGLSDDEYCCKAPDSYTGGCATCSNLMGYDESSLESWAQECGVEIGCCEVPATLSPTPAPPPGPPITYNQYVTFTSQETDEYLCTYGKPAPAQDGLGARAYVTCKGGPNFYGSRTNQVMTTTANWTYQIVSPDGSSGPVMPGDEVLLLQSHYGVDGYWLYLTGHFSRNVVQAMNPVSDARNALWWSYWNITCLDCASSSEGIPAGSAVSFVQYNLQMECQPSKNPCESENDPEAVCATEANGVCTSGCEMQTFYMNLAT